MSKIVFSIVIAIVDVKSITFQLSKLFFDYFPTYIFSLSSITFLLSKLFFYYFPTFIFFHFLLLHSYFQNFSSITFQLSYFFTFFYYIPTFKTFLLLLSNFHIFSLSSITFLLSKLSKKFSR
jgi:hypothetical protein